MNPRKIASTIDVAAAQLREVLLAAEPGSLIGSEETLVAQLGVSRVTVRQAARLLEREGLLRVKRGINGGYFAARPDLHSIENAVCAYLELLDTDTKEITQVGSALWIEVLAKAATLRSENVRSVAKRLQGELIALPANASFEEIFQLEQEIRKAIFELINSHYIELIFRINAVFAERRYPANPHELDNTDYHRNFVEAWRNAKLMELAAISTGDNELAIVAARHSRKIWHQRVWNEPNL